MVFKGGELLVAPVGIGACAHADEGGDEDGEGGEGGNDSVVHFCDSWGVALQRCDCPGRSTKQLSVNFQCRRL